MRVTTLLIIGLLSHGPTAGATSPDGVAPGPTPAVEAKAEAAQAAYQAGDFGAAVSLYLEAYQLAPAAALLYNVALIYDRKLQEPELAMSFYRRYIGAPDADPGAAVRATERLQVLKTEQRARQAASVILPEPQAPAEPQGVETREALTVREGPSTRAIVGWSLAGLGGATLVAGGAVALLARRTQREFRDSRELVDKLTLRNDGETQALMADVLLGAGAAVAVTGVVLALTGRERVAGVTPTADGRGALAWIGGVTW